MTRRKYIKKTKDMATKKGKEGDIIKSIVPGELDEQTKEAIPQPIDPLMEAGTITEGRENQKPIATGDINNVKPIPEPAVERPVIDINRPAKVTGIFDDEDESQEPGAEPRQRKPRAKKEEQAVEQPVFEPLRNPNMDDLPKKEVTRSAEHMADMAIWGLKKIYEVAYDWFSWSEQKIMRKAINGKIDMEVLDSEIDLGTRSITVGALLEDCNREMKTALTWDDDELEMIHALIIEIGKKRGLGVTPEEKLLFIVGTKLFQSISVVAAQNMLLNTIIKQQTVLIRQAREESRPKTILNEKKPKPKTYQEPEEHKEQQEDVVYNIDAVVVEDEPKKKGKK